MHKGGVYKGPYLLGQGQELCVTLAEGKMYVHHGERGKGNIKRGKQSGKRWGRTWGWPPDCIPQILSKRFRLFGGHTWAPGWPTNWLCAGLIFGAHTLDALPAGAESSAFYRGQHGSVSVFLRWQMIDFKGIWNVNAPASGYEGLHCAGQSKAICIYGGIQEWVLRWERDRGQKSGYKIAPSRAPGNVITAHWWEADIVEGLPACALRQNQGKWNWQ